MGTSGWLLNSSELGADSSNPQVTVLCLSRVASCVLGPLSWAVLNSAPSSCRLRRAGGRPDRLRELRDSPYKKNNSLLMNTAPLRRREIWGREEKGTGARQGDQRRM